MKVSVYRNLHTKSFSVRACEGPMAGKVIAHATDVLLENVTYHVGQATAAKVRETGRKSVHAYAVGDLLGLGRAVSFRGQYELSGCRASINNGPRPADLLVELLYPVEVYYNPYKTTSFVDGDTPLAGAETAFFYDGKAHRAYKPQPAKEMADA